jgi:hypothetical protein
VTAVIAVALGLPGSFTGDDSTPGASAGPVATNSPPRRAARAQTASTLGRAFLADWVGAVVSCDAIEGSDTVSEGRPMACCTLERPEGIRFALEVDQEELAKKQTAFSPGIGKGFRRRRHTSE